MKKAFNVFAQLFLATKHHTAATCQTLSILIVLWR
jgi:hypothetical protein